jgi:hypothetical protein
LGALTAKKVTWATAGLVTDPGRYMFKFGWLMIEMILQYGRPIRTPRLQRRRHAT